MTAEPDIELVVRVVLRVLDHLGRGPQWSMDHDGPRPEWSRLVTERDVVAAIPAGRLEVARGAVVTPLARDTAQEKGVELVEVG